MALTASRYCRAIAALEAVSWRGMRPGLERTEALLDALGRPDRGLRGVLVAGTNGKGSVCALVDSVLRAAGLSTVMLTKPHLTTYRERIVIDGAWITEAAFADLIESVSAVTAGLAEKLQPTGFEMMTVAGILAAARHGAQAVVCEVGLGGRLDSTNVLDLGVAAVTTVGLDHREHLGDTVEAIAGEKAAIIKPGDVAVTGATEPALGVIRTRCAAVGAPLTTVDPRAVRYRSRGREGGMLTAPFAGEEVELTVPLMGAFQAANSAVAVAICEALRQRGLPLSPAALPEGFARVRWPGRMQWVDGSPPLLVDGAHNPDGMAALAASLPELREDRRLAVVFAAMREKDVAAMAAVVAAMEARAVIVTAPTVSRATEPAALAALIPGAVTAPDPPSALAAARHAAGGGGLVVVCGSLYLAGEVLALVSEPRG